MALRVPAPGGMGKASGGEWPWPGGAGNARGELLGGPPFGLGMLAFSADDSILWMVAKYFEDYNVFG